MKKIKKCFIAFACIAFMMLLGLGGFDTKVQAANPYLPLWEHIPDGEPYVFEDPDNPGKYRVYVYGSHDTLKTVYCGYDQEVWSAPVDDLNNWRNDGVIFQSGTNGIFDVLYAPCVAEVKDANGKKTYYLYPNNQAYGRYSMIAKSDRPNGPFVPFNWKDGSTSETVGPIGFDPAILVDYDDNGNPILDKNGKQKVYGYWGVDRSYGAELDPDTMCTVKDGTKIVEDMVPSNKATDNNDFRFFEASSIRKVKGKYVFVYSRITKNGEFGLGGSNNTLAYAYSDSPLGPWTYGGTIIDARGRDKDENGKVITTNSWGNTHGSIIQINGKWYVFYHRCINTDGKVVARQGTVEPIDVNVTADGKVEIKEAEVTSNGFELNGLNPYENHSAGIACYLKDSSYGNPYVKATYDKRADEAPVINIKDKCVVGFKYFNFNEKPKDGQSTQLEMNITPMGTNGTIDIMIDSPWENKGTKLGTLIISENDPQVEIKKVVPVPGIDKVDGKHAIYFVFKSGNDKEICQFNDLKFSTVNTLLEDNFSDKLNKWKVNTGNPTVDNSELLVKNSDSITSNSGFEWNNYTFNSNVNISKGIVGLRFRQSDDRNYYEAQLKDGNVELLSILNGSRTVLKTASCALKSNESASISINCVDDVISVRVNGEMVLLKKNSDHNKGTIGISAYNEASAKISNIQVKTSSTKDFALETRSISIDGVTMKDFDMNNYIYNRVVDGNIAPKVTATSSDENMKISISQADGIPSKALVSFISDKERKTYTILFANKSPINPNSFEVLNPDNNTVTADSSVKFTTGGSDAPNCKNILRLPNSVSGNWAVEAKFSLNKPLDDPSIKKYANINMAIVKNYSGKDTAQAFDEKNYAKIAIQKNWADKAEALIQVNKDGSNKSAGFTNLEGSVYWLRAVKIGNILEGFVSTDGIKYTSLGTLTMSDDFTANSKLYLYASNNLDGTPYDVTISNVKIEKMVDDLSADTSSK